MFLEYSKITEKRRGEWQASQGDSWLGRHLASRENSWKCRNWGVGEEIVGEVDSRLVKETVGLSEKQLGQKWRYGKETCTGGRREVDSSGGWGHGTFLLVCFFAKSKIGITV